MAQSRRAGTNLPQQARALSGVGGNGGQDPDNLRNAISSSMRQTNSSSGTRPQKTGANQNAG